MLFRFFSKPTSPAQPGPAGTAAALPSKGLIKGPASAPESETSSAELDALTIFLPEDSLPASAPAALTTESRQAAARYASAVDKRDTRIASQLDKKRPDDFQQLLRQTQAALKQLKGDANTLRIDLSELRSLGDHLGQGYTRLADICRLTAQRSTSTGELLDAIEKRIEPLEILRDLSATTEEGLASLKRLVDEVARRGVSFETQKEAIDRGRAEATRVGLLMDELQARVKAVTDKAEWLRRAEETVGRLEQRAIETTARLERRVNDFGTQQQTIEHAVAEAIRVTAILGALEGRIRALTGGDQGIGHAEDTISRLEHRTTATMAEFEQRVGDVDARRHGIEQALVAAVTGSDRELRRAEETVGRLEQRADALMGQLERRVDDLDAQKRTIEQTTAEATRVTAILGALEGRVTALIGRERVLGQAETAIGQLEQRTAEVRVRLEQVVRAKSDIEHEFERVGKQLQTLTESARNSVSVLRSTDPSRSSAWKIGRHLRRPAALLALVAVALLAIVLLRTRDQPNQIAGTVGAAHQEPPVAARGSLLPSTASGFAMFEMPGGRAPATTGRMAAHEVSSANRRDPPRAARTAQAAGASQSASSNETAQYVGALTVDSEPTGSVVYVDRQRVGETPLQLTHLRAGSHVVRIERDGYDRWTTAVLVVADEQTRVRATLQPARDRR